MVDPGIKHLEFQDPPEVTARAERREGQESPEDRWRAELQQTETKLTELQTKRNDQSSLALSPEQEAELKKFVAEKARVRKELRETQRGLDVDIDRLDSWLKVINMAIAPLCVAVVGVIILSLRRRRRSTGSGAT